MKVALQINIQIFFKSATFVEVQYAPYWNLGLATAHFARSCLPSCLGHPKILPIRRIADTKMPRFLSVSLRNFFVLIPPIPPVVGRAVWPSSDGTRTHTPRITARANDASAPNHSATDPRFGYLIWPDLDLNLV